MEMTGVAEAAQFINVSINGTETILKLTGSFVHFTGHELKELIKFFMAQHKAHTHNKALKPGEVKIADMMDICSKNHEQLGCIQLDLRIKDEFIQFCNDNGLSYSFLLDVNKNDNFEEVIYRGSQAPVMETFLASRYPLAKPYSLEEYRDNATVEGFYEAEQLIKDAEQKLVPVALNNAQITGVSEDEIEVCITDEKNIDSYVIFPRERLRQKDDQFMLAVADKDYMEAYDRSAFKKDEKGMVIKVTNEARESRGNIRGEYLREMIRLKSSDLEKVKTKGTTFVNKKTKDKLTVSPEGIGKVIPFPAKDGPVKKR